MRYLLVTLAISLMVFLPGCIAPVEASTHQAIADPFAAQYDANNNNLIDKDEVIAAITDYIQGEITKEQAIAIFILYVNNTPIQEQTSPPSITEVVARILPSVVKILNPELRSQGSGVIYRIDGQNAYIITNAHVIRTAARVTVTVGNRKDYEGTVLGVDDKRDLAVVRICCHTGFQAVDFGDSEQLEIGDSVLAIGYPVDSILPKDAVQPRVIVNPGEVSATVTRGIVSAVRYDSENDRELLQTDAPSNPGNSGGPLFTLDGTVVGIITFGIGFTEGLHFAIMETTVQKHLPTLEKGTPPDPDTYQREYVFRPFAGPWPGHLHHDPDGSGIVNVRTRFRAQDLVASARFYNPYDGGTHRFSYGFILRDSAPNPSIAFVLHSNKEWFIRRYVNHGWESIARGPAPNLDIRAGRNNFIRVGAVGNYGWIELNGETLTDSNDRNLFQLGDDPYDGTVRLITGFLDGDTQQNAVTRFGGFMAEEVIGFSLLSGPDGVERVRRAYHQYQSESQEYNSGNFDSDTLRPHRATP